MRCEEHFQGILFKRYSSKSIKHLSAVWVS